MQVHYYENIRVGDIQLTNPRKLNNKYRSSVRGQRLFVQSPQNLSGQIKHADDGTKIFDINLDSSVLSFVDFIQSIDEHCIDLICEHSEQWFKGRKLCDDIVRRVFRSALVSGRDGTQLKTKFQYDDYGDEVTCVFDELSNIYEDPKENVDYQCSVILEFNGCWFGKSEMHSEWSVAQIKIYDDASDQPSVDILPDSDSDEYYDPDAIVFDE